jgi:hypothetical protein
MISIESSCKTYKFYSLNLEKWNFTFWEYWKNCVYHYNFTINGVCHSKIYGAYNKATKLKDPTLRFTKKLKNKEDFNLVLATGYYGAILAWKHFCLFQIKEDKHCDAYAWHSN